MGPRGAGRRLNDQERMEILEIIQREAKVKNVDLAKRYGVSEGAIRKLKQMKDTVRNRYFMGNEHNRDKRKRGGFQRNAPFEEELYQWIVRMRESQPYQLMPLTQTAVRQQAIVLAKNYDKMANFKASPGWFARFCSRHRLDPIVTNGDAAPAASGQGAGDTSVDHAMAGPAAAAAEASTTTTTTTTTTDETVYLLDALTESPVVASQPLEMEMEGAATAVSGSDAVVGSKTEATPSINEQVQQAAREHNEAALRAAVAKTGETQGSAEGLKSEEEEEEEEEKEVDVKVEVNDETEEAAKGVKESKESDEMFSLGL